ncbi:dihydrolipoamide acetyltransferase family protein [Alkalitalea saponilacus]|uniref:Dihydrolipoamide acetyltransferase component of pyruvate dehydrogenase complex n=1 Tax=Alkalitalea saponilacus TaxID=889453 RepID=A0A1T5DC20_9BACT|nr:dihydrolipoamide acetyltransferase family protein [Alkalitalea saponilacus]ASB50655.1 diapophytoene dehydrogenase [Alkalitalea saponilacus]SKB69171.1 2-oxoglutarate dehydrogenase E2 component (dihydrolipoamide succinyltransferase) [Alkalitalea saponilacus]
MSTFEILMPKMGESVEEATITKWFVKQGDVVEEDQVLLEIATDKVDSEIPSPVAGVIKEIKFETDALVPVGQVVAIIDMDADGSEEAGAPDEEKEETESKTKKSTDKEEKPSQSETKELESKEDYSNSNRFYSPLVKSIAKEENISLEELDKIEGTGKEGRVTKADILSYLENRGSGSAKQTAKAEEPAKATQSAETKQAAAKAPEVKASEGDEIVEMDRMRKIIAEHMVMSKQVSPHVTSMVEADVTNLVLWRNNNKDAFQKKYGEKLTFMPVFTHAVAKALRDYPGINASVSGTNIIIRKNVNVGIAVALPSGNLIVPVIKQADQKNLVGLASDINSLAAKARDNKLSSDDIQGGTFTITNFGSFKNTIGTPIINQPQVAILATGTIEKKPAVIETPTGDVIAIRHKMFLSLSYDHRVVDGALGGYFLRRVADYLEEWKIDEAI